MTPLLSFLCWSALLLGAAVPLAIGWARLLPPDDPDERLAHDSFAIVLLFLVTLSFVPRIPGLSLAPVQAWLAAFLPGPWPARVIFVAWVCCMVVPSLAAAYAILRPNTLRIQLITAGLLVPLLWFLTPYLSARLLGGSRP